MEGGDHMSRQVRSVLAVAACAMLVSCGSDTKDPTGGGGGETHSEETIGTEGGSVDLGDGQAGVEIPSGALPEGTTITVTATPEADPPEDAEIVGAPVTFGPEGQTFSVPVTVTLTFDPASVPEGVSTADLVVYTAPAGTTDFS